MRFDDPRRPQNEAGAHKSALQTNGSPLPVITLMFPMQNGDAEGGEWGFLACVHAHKERNSFGTYYGWIRDLGQFQRDYLASPEDALRTYFKYNGPDIVPSERGVRALAQKVDADIFAEGD